MSLRLDPSWQDALSPILSHEAFKKLTDFVRAEYEKTSVYPAPNAIFRALDLCPFQQVKVVILGQDPYHGPGQANGLSFSVNAGVPLPPSLQNIFEELSQDLGLSKPNDGNLERWAKQGVLLLNATLTVRAGAAGSHQGQGWEAFTDCIIETLAKHREHLVFVLWGRHAQNKASMIDPKKHLILKAPHPSPLSSYRGFFGSKPFSQANAYLTQTGQSPIDWA